VTRFDISTIDNHQMSKLPSKPAFSSRRQEQEWMRLQGVKMVRNGVHPSDVAKGFGVSTRAVYQWLAAYQEGGGEALLGKKGGGRPPRLDRDQLAYLASNLRTHTPDQLGFPSGLWTLRLVGELIERLFDWKPSLPTLGKLMALLGFTPQRPLYRAYQQDAAEVQQWRSDRFPEIQRRAKASGATVLFADESGIRSDYHTGTTWAPIGQTPIVPATGKRFGVNMLSAISGLGEMEFMLHEGSVDSSVFVRFLEHLMMDRVRPVILIVDGHPIHHSRRVLDYVRSTGGRLELEYLPPYSPQLNPDEQVWKCVKAEIAKQVPKTGSELREIARQALRALAARTETIIGFFRHPDCQYALPN
jgi:transposase